MINVFTLTNINNKILLKANWAQFLFQKCVWN